MNDPCVEIKNLNIIVRQTGLHILKNINLSLERGIITGIVGESGSGKSMTALSILGLLPPALHRESGQILFYSEKNNPPADLCNKDMAGSHRGRKITMIFQEPMTSLNPSMSCGKQISESLDDRLYPSTREKQEKIISLLQKVKLNDPQKAYNSFPHQLSGGQRQRIMIAMALASNPALLVADEPTTALDVTVQKEIILLLKELSVEFRLSVMFISHDLRLLSDLAREIVVMRRGEIVESGPAATILKHPGENYTRALISCQPSLNNRPVRLPTVEDFENNTVEEADRKPVIRSNNPLLTINRLNLYYRAAMWGKSGSHHALKSIDCAVNEGECLGLVGESGSGKTSLGKSILGLISTGSGDIIYRGMKLNGMSRKELRKLRKNIQVVFQDPYSSLNPLFTIRATLMEARRLHFPREKKETSLAFIEELLEKTGLKKTDLEKYPHEFSGGQRQRICIARALATEPEFLILDEAVSALDVSVQAQILNLLNKLRSDYRLSYLFISHDLAVVKYISDRIMVMKDGEIVETGYSDEIYLNPASEYTRKLISSIPGIR